MKCNKNYVAIALHNEIQDLDSIIKKRKNGEETEDWVTCLEKRRNALISYLEEINKSAINEIEINVTKTITL